MNNAKTAKTAFFVTILLLAAANVFGQTGLLRLSNYSNLFLNRVGRLDSKYLYPASDEDYDRFCVLGGDIEKIDIPLEISLFSYYSPDVNQIRPPEADAILPANNPRLADQKLGAAVFQEIQILRFLNDTAAVTRHEAVLRFITDRGNVTRQEVEAFYRNNIRALISDVVDEEFRYPGEQIRRNNQAGINTVPPAFINEVKQKITNFFLTPNQQNLNDLKNLTTALELRSRYADITKAWSLANAFGDTAGANRRLSQAQEYQSRLNSITRNLNMPDNFRIADDNPSFWLYVKFAYNGSIRQLNQEIARMVDDVPRVD
uniref:Uncharacterized protein n=1 Tax=uncultured bacterium contig00021 TaxID=1181511 RepID=A0A806K2S1_9BACT|nr:hypothetical protein [uncultured bacterium contig00021]